LIAAGHSCRYSLHSNLPDGPQISCPNPPPADVQLLFLRLFSAAFFARQMENAQRRQSARVYTAGVVVWLMVAQRLNGLGSLQTSVLELMVGLPEAFWDQPCQRLRPGPEGQMPKLSSNTGALNQARQQLPVTVTEECLDQSFAQLTAEFAGPRVAGQPAFFLDGTSVRLAHSEALLKLYPASRNQHGENHWPVLRMLVAHDVDSALAMRPHWGAMYGPQAVSEQGLLEECIDRLPDGALVLADSNFGVFSVAYAADQRGHPMLLRLTAQRAKSLLQGPLQDGTDRHIQWRPSRDDRRKHPQLPADASVTGRVIVRRVQPSNGKEAFLLALFTTLTAPAEEVVAIYGRRWNIETDLRHLKENLGLHQLACTSPEMVAKEIHAAMLAYNLVRAVTWLAARETGLPPRAFGFTRVSRVVRAFAPLIAAARSEAEAREILERMMYYVRQAKIYPRKRRSYPREVWPQPQAFPVRKV
jgi:hypothetical protein